MPLGLVRTPGAYATVQMQRLDGLLREPVGSVAAAGGHGHAVRPGTSSIDTGRCSRRERVQASATRLLSTASAIGQGDVRVPATMSVKATSSARNASANRSRKELCG